MTYVLIPRKNESIERRKQESGAKMFGRSANTNALQKELPKVTES